jgi:Na+-transporting methylmalonyl-CoA/oxaloacetate decarboxylase gamma subunit
MSWLINFLPEWVFHIVIFLGIGSLIASAILKRLPALYTYSFVTYFAGLVLIISGVWFEGALAEKSNWEEKVKELETKAQVAEAKSQQVNTVIETKVVERVKIVKDTKNANKETAKLIARQLDDRCVVPESTVVLINSASQNEVARGASSTDGTASDVRASEVVETVVENYGRYNELREKVIAWQKWYLEQKKIFEEAKK